MKDLTKTQLDTLHEIDFDSILGEWPAELRKTEMKCKSSFTFGEKRSYGFVHPSSLGYGCDRALYYQLTDEDPSTPKIGGNMQRRLDIGTALHALFATYQHTRAMYHGYEYDSEVPVQCKTVKMAGTMDGISKGWPLPIKVIWEYKTMAINEFNRLHSPKEEHIEQVCAYMNGADIPVSLIMYIQKDSADTKTFIVPYSCQSWAEIENRIETIQKQANKKKKPERKTGFACKMCSFFESCKPEKLSDGIPSIRKSSNG